MRWERYGAENGMRNLVNHRRRQLKFNIKTERGLGILGATVHCRLLGHLVNADMHFIYAGEPRGNPPGNGHKAYFHSWEVERRRREGGEISPS